MMINTRRIAAGFLLGSLFLPPVAQSKNTKTPLKLSPRPDAEERDIAQPVIDALNNRDKVISIAFGSANFLNILTVISRDETGYQVINYNSVNAEKYALFYAQWQNNDHPNIDNVLAMRVGANLMRLKHNRSQISHQEYGHEIQDAFGNIQGIESIEIYKNNPWVNEMIEKMMATQMQQKVTGALKQASP